MSYGNVAKPTMNSIAAAMMMLPHSKYEESGHQAMRARTRVSELKDAVFRTWPLFGNEKGILDVMERGDIANSKTAAGISIVAV